MKSLSRKVGVILIGLAISGYGGCSSGPKYWTKADYDPDIYRMDESFCQQQGKRGADKSIKVNEIYKQCMYSLGYFLTPEKEKWAGVKDEEVWKYYFSNDDHWAYYDARTITLPSKDVITLWVRWNLSKRFVREFEAEHGNEFENLSYIKQSVEVDCLEKKAHSLSMAIYDRKGILILSSDRPWEWSLSFPRLENHSLYKEVCK
ncbi:MAG TPA: surface-adhesin E family protein [Thermodesulfobacteriota bacterium]|nr:surface-adhesin E family protein [Thermodesulfobacteriota bacterium]